MPYNQSKHADVCQYVDYLQNFIVKLRAAEVPNSECGDINDAEKDLTVPLFGDQLGRERVTGAKKTRLGCDLASER